MKSFFPLFLWLTSTMKQFVTNEAAFAVLRWNKRIGEFLPIPGLPSYEMQAKNHALKTRQEEIHDFNGEPLHLTYYQELGFFHFSDNDTKVSGIYGDLWTTLSELLNFTLVLKRNEVPSVGGLGWLPNGTYGGMLDDILQNRTDIIPKLEVFRERGEAVRFTLSFWMNSYRTFAHGAWQRSRAWIFKQFSVEVWCHIFLFIVLLSVGCLATQRVLTRLEGPMLRTTLSDHIFYTIGTICNQSSIPRKLHVDSSSNGVKILMFTVSTFSWFILVGYGARLMYSLAHEVFAAPYNDLPALYDKTNLQVVVTNGSVSHLVFALSSATWRDTVYNRIKRANRLTVVSTVEELSEKVCLNHDKYVLVDGDDEVNVRTPRICNLLPANPGKTTVPMASGMSRRVQNKKTIDIGILKLREWGITKAIKNRYFALREKRSSVRHRHSMIIDLDQLSLVLAILAIGVVASVAICIAENIFFALNNRKINRPWLHRLPVTEQSLLPRNMTAGNCKSPTNRSGNLYFMELYNCFEGKPKILWRPLIRDD